MGRFLNQVSSSPTMVPHGQTLAVSRPRTASFGHRIDRLRQRLKKPLPGRSAHMVMSPSRRTYVTVESARRMGCREAGTLALLFPVDGAASTVLTLRSGELTEHAGQVSLPGGQMVVGERVIDCACREAAEELGLAADGLELVGGLTPLYVPPSGYCISPVVAAVPARPRFTPQPAEVAEVFEVELDRLVDGSLRSVETKAEGDEVREIPRYTVGTHIVWGATAMILAELAQVWRESIDGENRLQ